jgi:hypothetical protein
MSMHFQASPYHACSISYIPLFYLLYGFQELSKEGGRAEKEKKAGDAELRIRDVRLQRAMEEVEKYKQMLQDIRAQVREDGEKVRMEESGSIPYI